MKTLAGDSLRFAICLLPFAAAAAGAASEVVVLLFGEHFAPAGPLLARLIFAEVALVVVSIATAILVAQAQHRWLSAFGAAIVVLALVGHGFAVPRFGPIGAASVTLFVASVGAVATAAAAYAGSRLLPPFATIGRTALVAAAAYWATSVFPTPGLGVVVKLIGVAAGIPVLFYGLGEIGQRERAQIAGLLGLERRSGDAPKDP